MVDQGFARILWRGKWLVLASLAVCVALAIVATKLSAKVYAAQTTIQVNAGGTSGSNNASPSDIVNANQGLAQTYASLITDNGFLEQVHGSILGGRHSASYLAGQLSARAVPNTSLVQLTAQAPSEQEAQALAAGVAKAFVRTVQNDAVGRTDNMQTQIQGLVHSLDQKIAAGGSPETIASLRSARTELERQLATLVAGQIAAGASVSLSGPATGSSSPVKPRPTLNLIAGILLGILLGCLLAWLRAALDRGLHSSAEVERLLDAPTLGRIPLLRRYSSEDPVLGEAFDVLRANLAFLSTERTMQVLTITSFNPREGKSSTVEGLAHAAVRGGLDVLMIDGDVRTHALSERLGYGSAPGLTNLIVGMATTEDTIVELSPGLSLLPAGPMPPNPPSLLASTRMRELVDDLRGAYPLVIVDSPPVGHLADASILAAISDGVMAIARIGVTRRTDLPAGAATLRQVPTPLIGVVLLESREIDDTYYPAVARGVRREATGPDGDDGPPRRTERVETF